MTQHTSTSHPHKRPKEHAVNLWKLAMILAFASGIIVTALFLFIAFVPEEQQRGPQANSMLKSNNKPLTISQKILRWLPKDHLPASSHPTTSSEENYGSLSNDTQIIYHSRFKTTDDYVPWLPFANQHSSRRFEVTTVHVSLLVIVVVLPLKSISLLQLGCELPTCSG